MRKYDSYKDSGIEWIGKIPSHWTIATVGRLSNLGRGRVISAIEIAENEGEYPVYSSQTENNGVMGRLDSFDFEGEYVTWTTDGANAGTVFYREGKFNCTNVCGTIQPKNWEQIDLKFLPYYLNLGTKFSVRLDINPKLMNNMMAKIPLVIPTKSEQTTIATYLDRKTAEIDELIADKKRLLELYEEEKNAIINQAVTKGINPDVPMKDSGIEWLGVIPAHWEVIPITKYLESIVDYRGRTPKKQNNGLFLVTARNIKNRIIDYSLSEEFVDEEDAQNLLNRGYPKIGDVLFTTEAPLGEVANIDREDIALAQRIIKFRGRKDLIDNYYLMYFMSSDCFRQHLYSYSTGSTAIGIKASKLHHLKCLLPPIVEQQSIVRHIETECARIDTKKAKTEKLIELLTEYRTALISEVVTGKIKVIE